MELRKPTIKKLAELYDIDRTTFYRYRRRWMASINKLASKYWNGKRWVKKKWLNSHQVQKIVQIMQDPPEGYKCVRGKLIKFEE